MKRAPLYLQFFFLIPAFAGCRVTGPPFRDAEAGEMVPDIVASRRYLVQLALPFYRSNQTSELTFDKSARGDRIYFRMRTAGRNPIESIRVRSYEGTARRIGEDLELRSDHCYVFGKKDWEDRLTPLEGWDCEHLYFRMKPYGSLDSVGMLTSVSGERTSYSEWLGEFTAAPMPESTFAGQILAKLDDTRVIVWGYDAGHLLRDGQILGAYHMDPLGKSAEQPAGTLKVISRPGDFVLAQWQERYANSAAANVALTRAPRPGGGSIF